MVLKLAARSVPIKLTLSLPNVHKSQDTAGIGTKRDSDC